MTGPDYTLISHSAGEMETLLTKKYEELAHTTVQPASPERLLIAWFTSILLHLRVLMDYAARQNIPSRAEGENLDALAELTCETSRPQAAPAHTTMRFHISQAQNFPVLIPKGTRVTDRAKTLYWNTTEDVYIPAGETAVEAQVLCQTSGKIGNGYVPGQISSIVDLYDYYAAAENITASEGGTDTATDAEFRELLRLSMDGYSTAGSIGSYVYHAKRASTDIIDVCANSPQPGVVYLYTLMRGGEAAGEEIKDAVLAACNAENVRPLTDSVHVGDPEIVEYDIDLIYYATGQSMTGAAELKAAVEQAVDEYVQWQCAKLGRDINPSRLLHLLMMAGIKRADIRKPVFTRLRDGKLAVAGGISFADTIPQIAHVRQISVIDGGREDE